MHQINISMATITKIQGIEKNSYDYATAYAKTLSSNSVVVDELVQAYTLAAKNLGMSVFDFIQTVKSKGTDKQQAVYLATHLNNVRPRSALLGVISSHTTPAFIDREIGA